MENKNVLKTEQTVKISWEKIQSEMKDKFGSKYTDKNKHSAKQAVKCLMSYLGKQLNQSSLMVL